MKINYDIGANNGDDIPYYLQKSDFVIAVEANPELCNYMQKRFQNEIRNRRLVIENCVLLEDKKEGKIPFYIHKDNHVISQFPRPKKKIENFKQVELPGKSVDQLFKMYGFPYYVKIDVERYDHVILNTMFSLGINPRYLSAECHKIKVFLLLVSNEAYQSFKVVKGYEVTRLYKNHCIQTKNGEKVIYSFPHHSAGPFGEDIKGEWMNSESLFNQLKREGLGWKDIHAKAEINNNKRGLNKISRLKYWYYWCRWQSIRFCKKTKRTAREILT